VSVEASIYALTNRLLNPKTTPESVAVADFKKFSHDIMKGWHREWRRPKYATYEDYINQVPSKKRGLYARGGHDFFTRYYLNTNFEGL